MTNSVIKPEEKKDLNASSNKKPDEKRVTINENKNNESIGGNRSYLDSLNSRVGKQSQSYFYGKDVNGSSIIKTDNNNSVADKPATNTSENYGRVSHINTIRETYADGSVYEGEKQAGLRHGKGKFYYSDGGMYDGEWFAGSIEGYGTLFYAGGQKAYEGRWINDKFDGKGTLFNENPLPLSKPFDYTNFETLGQEWIKYEGDFVRDNKDGRGTLYLTNGERYEGQFRDDTIHGYGTFYKKDGACIIGQWKSNKLFSAESSVFT